MQVSLSAKNCFCSQASVQRTNVGRLERKEWMNVSLRASTDVVVCNCKVTCVCK